METLQDTANRAREKIDDVVGQERFTDELDLSRYWFCENNLFTLRFLFHTYTHLEIYQLILLVNSTQLCVYRGWRFDASGKSLRHAARRRRLSQLRRT
jgi:hypothetical protein